MEGLIVVAVFVVLVMVTISLGVRIVPQGSKQVVQRLGKFHRTLGPGLNIIKDNELPVTFLLGEKYIEALKYLSSSQNSKVIVLPGDIPAAVRGIISAVGK